MQVYGKRLGARLRSTRRTLCVVAPAFAASAALAFAPSAHATDYTWTGAGAGGAWENAGNWSSPGNVGGVPDDQNDTATIGSTAFDTILSTDKAIGALTLTGGTLSIQATRTLTLKTTPSNVASTWSGGGVSLSGALVNEDTLTITGSAASTIGPFRNTGTVIFDRITQSTFTPFDNDGAVQVKAGTFALNGNNASGSTGTWQIDAGASLRALNAFDTFTGSVTGAGQFEMAGGDITVAGTAAFTPGELRIGFGAVSLTTTSTALTVGGIPAWDVGTLSVPTGRTVTVTGAASLSSGTLGGGGTLKLGDTTKTGGTFGVDNGSTLELGGTTTFATGSFATSGATLKNTGTLTMDGNTSITGFAPGGLDNRGTLTFDSPGGRQIWAATNSGTMDLADGTWSDGGPGAALTQTAGSTVLGPSTQLNTGAALQGGTFSGRGTVESITNTGGTVAPGASPGKLTVTGDYTQGAGGTLAAELTDTGQGTDPGYDWLSVGGTAALGGTLAVTVGGGFTPTTADTFDVVTATSVTGSFATVTGALQGARPWVATSLADRARLTLGDPILVPSNLTAPSITGTPAVGSTLGCNPGTWAGSPTAFSFQWLRDGVPVTPQPGPVLVVTAADQGATFTCVVTAVNAGGSSQATASAGLKIPSAASPPTAAPPPTPTPPASAAPASVAITTIATLPPAKACVSRRKFPIRLRGVKANKIVRAQIRLNGRQVRNVTGKALRLPIDLRGLPKGRFTVEIVTTDAAGKKLVGKRTYRTCVPRKKG